MQPKEAPKEGGFIDAGLLLALATLGLAGLVFFAAGCSPMPTMMRGIATAAVVTSVGYHGLNAVDATHEGEIKATAEAGYPVAAKAHAADWRPKYIDTRQGLDICAATVEIAVASLPTIEAAKDKKKQVIDWVLRLTRLATDVAGALKRVGVNVPSPASLLGGAQ
jgi:hypothetical protein